MSYRVVTRVTFTPEFSRFTEEEQTNELIEATSIVSRNGGVIESTTVVPSEQTAIVLATYPDEKSSMKSHLQIAARGAYRLEPQRAYSLEDWLQIQAEARAEAVVPVG